MRQVLVRRRPVDPTESNERNARIAFSSDTASTFSRALGQISESGIMEWGWMRGPGKDALFLLEKQAHKFVRADWSASSATSSRPGRSLALRLAFPHQCVRGWSLVGSHIASGQLPWWGIEPDVATRQAQRSIVECRADNVVVFNRGDD